MEPNLTTLLTQRRLAGRLGVTRRTLERWRTEGIGPPFGDAQSLLNRVRWRTRELDEEDPGAIRQPGSGCPTLIELISATTTRTGLIVRCVPDTRDYPKSITVSDEEMDACNIKGDAFHPEWNYTDPPGPAI